MNAQGETARKTRVLRAPRWLRAVCVPLVLAALILCLRLFLFDVRPVSGESMRPTLMEGEWVLVSRTVYSLRAPRYGELVVCHPKKIAETWIKRVVGLPDDILRAEDGVLYRNDLPVPEPYLATATTPFSPIKAWEDEYLLLGDHRESSADSRVAGIGAIKREELVGRAVLVIWPPSSWRAL